MRLRGGERRWLWHRWQQRRRWGELGRGVPVAALLSILFDRLASRRGSRGLGSLFWV